jgi:hypothetical protein
MSKSSAALGSLKLSLDISDQYGKDASEGIGVTATYKEVEIKANPKTGKYEKSEVEKKSPVKKDIDARADELSFYKGQVDSLKEVTFNADKKLFDIVTEINSKKNQIIEIITEATAVGCGCSFVVPLDTVVNGVTLGVGATFVQDYAYVKSYPGLDSGSDSPYESESKSTMTQNNIGKGFETGYNINYVEDSGDPSTGVQIVGFTSLTGLANAFAICDDSECADKLSQVEDLAAEIGSLRSKINNQLISDTNTVKEEQSKNELFVWSYEHTENSNADTRNKTANVQAVIKNQSGFD